MMYMSCVLCQDQIGAHLVEVQVSRGSLTEKQGNLVTMTHDSKALRDYVLCVPCGRYLQSGVHHLIMQRGAPAVS